MSSRDYHPRQTTRRSARIAWCAALAVCPFALMLLAAFVGQTGISYSERPWPVRAISSLWYVHLGLSVGAAVAAIRVWGQRWWLGWAGIVFAGWVTSVVGTLAIFSTVAYAK